jgi:hypothetical protein
MQPEESTTPHPKRKRDQLSHLLIDVDFLDKPKVKALLHRFGPLAQFYLIKIYMALSRATDAEMSIDAAKGLAWEIRLEDEADAILECLLEQEMLHSPRAGIISSERVAKDQEALAESRERWRAKKGAAASPPSPRLPRRFPGDSPETPPPIPRKCVKSEDLNNEDLKTNGNWNFWAMIIEISLFLAILSYFLHHVKTMLDNKLVL